MPAKKATTPDEPAAAAQAEAPVAEKAKGEPRKMRVIPGNFSYTTSAGVLAKVLQKLAVSERPPQFTTDFLGSVLGATGGSSRPIIPILKKAGLLRADGVPTDLYAQFQNEGRRAQAALEALKNGWSELFRRNQYVHKLERKPTEDLFVEITGLTRDDPTFRVIIGTYYVSRDYAKDASADSSTSALGAPAEAASPEATSRLEERTPSVGSGRLNLISQVSIVLPETSDINVYNAIFRSLRENLLS